MALLNTPSRRRIGYIDGMLLDAGDLSTEQSYYQDRLALLASRLGEGVVAGLEIPEAQLLRSDCTSVKITINAGIAIARSGRLLVVDKPLQRFLEWPEHGADDVRLLALKGCEFEEVFLPPLLPPKADSEKVASGHEANERVRYTEGVEAGFYLADDALPAEAVTVARLRRVEQNGTVHFEVDTEGTRLAFWTVDELASTVDELARTVMTSIKDAETRLAATSQRLTIQSRAAEALLRQGGDGIVEGLTVETISADGIQLAVREGVAIDIKGRALVLTREHPVDVDPEIWSGTGPLVLAAASEDVLPDEATETDWQTWSIRDHEIVLLLTPHANLPPAAVTLAGWHAPNANGEREPDHGPNARRLMPTTANLTHVDKVNWWHDGSAWCVGVAFERALQAPSSAISALITVERPSGEFDVLPSQLTLDPEIPECVQWHFSVHPHYVPASGDLLRLRLNCAGILDINDLPVIAATRPKRIIPAATGGVFEACYLVDGPPVAKVSP
jgi:hypothetical protein